MSNCSVIGLTGGIGSGKSEAARILAGFGAVLIDADAVARETLDEPSTLEALERELGSVVIGDDGKFARKKVASIAFKDKEFLKTLNRISHKFVSDKVFKMVDDIANAAPSQIKMVDDPTNAAPSQIIVIDAPIPVERGFLDLSDEVWVITASHGKRLERIIKRDGISKYEAEARMNSQPSDEEYKRIADRLISNNNTFADLKKELEHIWKTFRKNIKIIMSK